MEVASGCRGCHDGTQAPGTPSGHFITTLECSTCQQYADATLTTIEKARSSEHRANRGDW